MTHATDPTTVTAAAISELRNRIQGSVFSPGEQDWDSSRRAWNLAADQQPALIAVPESAADVVAVVGFASVHGLSVTPQGTGHGAAGLGPLAGTLLVKTQRMRSVKIDPEARRARVEAGAWWKDVTIPAAEHGLAALSGSSADVGVVGYTLGGGAGFLGRQFGSAAASVHAIELVTADARLKRVDADHEPDLFWALRGGGGSFGIVTAIEFALYPVSEVYAGVLFWPEERSAEVLKAWSAWTRDVPDQMTSLGRVLHLPPLPQIPDPLRGRSFVVVELAYVGEEAEGAELIGPLRALGPEIDTVAVMPPSRLSELHMDPPEPVPAAGDGMLLREFGAEAAEALAAVASGPLLSIEIRHFGGALGRPPSVPCACMFADANFAMFAVGMVMSPEMGAAVNGHVDAVCAALAPYGTGRSSPNFTDRPHGSSALFPPEVDKRLQEVRGRYDPSGLFQASFQIPVGNQ